MRWIALSTLSLLMLAPALAQSDQQPSQPPRLGAERPVDNGPTTPQSNSAYQGGGVVLESGSGTPPPASAAVGLPEQPPPTR